AEQLHMPERVAGMNANLGRVALARGDVETAKSYLYRALELAEQIEQWHLATRSRIWVAPILSSQDRRRILDEAGQIAEQHGYHGLLDQITEIDSQIY